MCLTVRFILKLIFAVVSQSVSKFVALFWACYVDSGETVKVERIPVSGNVKTVEVIIYSDKIKIMCFTHPSSVSLQRAVVHCLVVWHLLGFISTILRMSLLLLRQ